MVRRSALPAPCADAEVLRQAGFAVELSVRRTDEAPTSVRSEVSDQQAAWPALQTDLLLTDAPTRQLRHAVACGPHGDAHDQAVVLDQRVTDNVHGSTTRTYRSDWTRPADPAVLDQVHQIVTMTLRVADMCGTGASRMQYRNPPSEEFVDRGPQRSSPVVR